MRSTAILCLIGIFAVSVLANENLWQRSHRAQADESHTVVFAVKLQKDALATCDSMLMEVSGIVITYRTSTYVDFQTQNQQAMENTSAWKRLEN
jgi:hypothetical protein